VVNPQEGGIAGLIFGGKDQFDHPVFFTKFTHIQFKTIKKKTIF